ncbi:bacitracin resistance protein [Candidatus Blochmanniella pennsylvanica str. BPEN]|uniref:Undecaprenyl-diphosphatase n=1 Tax=Blochmanniella pennsylvanica (strain BPEN) TaxID=291272 RepID=UPPP_BLOPB|nr:undecaprenyl-diphosphatase UppP [Candidatus Blochmannia pennsylvanicus]Q493X5.1 RecName: Full=Undecaprenyl-diphosphatase; AltName: Full=Bacitracin resistance protein; AltName: Full=Undecaprenyl pyrophosphate phosphatase [Candidatus Blochmannia pennsylvanicus str. BPEN]AAZ40709.1 bacitracin resistance protein [Candidatus Blochmannia pennsylvanicus str. BPEN]UOY04493.1 undecaprenyl-diphosphatase UppP [Candidatus Blochmannia pennsylvanicus]
MSMIYITLNIIAYVIDVRSLILDVRRLVFSLILGIVEGLTEFLPISSTGHMILVENILNCMDDSVIAFTVIIQLGAILSITKIFWSQLYGMSMICIKKIFFKQHDDHNHLCIRHIFLGTFPGIMLGMIFYEKIGLIFELTYIMYGLIIGGIFLLVGELCASKEPRVSRINNITYLQAFLIGCFQCLAFWPGFSRAGATIGGGLVVGLDRRISSEFSFFLAVPIIFGSAVLTLYHYRSCIGLMDVLLLIAGSATAFFIALFTVRYFLKIVKNVSLIPFAIYRFLLAGGIYWGLMT